MTPELLGSITIVNFLVEKHVCLLSIKKTRPVTFAAGTGGQTFFAHFESLPVKKIDCEFL